MRLTLDLNQTRPVDCLAGPRRKNVEYQEQWFINKRFYQDAAKTWRVYLLNELERFSKHPRHPKQNDTVGFNAQIDWFSHIAFVTQE